MPEAQTVSKSAIIAGRIISILAILFLVADSIMKLIKPAFVVEATIQLGYAESMIAGIGIALLVSTILYAIPRTAIPGAFW